MNDQSIYKMTVKILGGILLMILANMLPAQSLASLESSYSDISVQKKNIHKLQEINRLSLSEKLTVGDVLSFLSEKYQVNFSYLNDLVAKEIIPSKVLDLVEVEPILREMFKDSPYRYEEVDTGYYVIYIARKKENSSFSLKFTPIPPGSVKERITSSPAVIRSLPSRNILKSIVKKLALEITGQVVDQNGEPLIGVNVLVEGSNKGTATDIDGRFVLEDVNENATLIFSYIGYQTQEFVLNGRSNIVITMAEDLQTLDEVVVVGYGTQKKSDITGAVSSISTEEFENEPIANVTQGLQGKVAGVNVTSGSGAPGGNMIVRIRGNTSVLGSNDPLYVIDGVPRIGDTDLLSTMNPSDIESIEILKDASATAIYGSRGSNGVILITTKIGKAGRNLTEFETSIGYREIENQLEMLNSRQFAEIANERNTNDGLPEIFTDVNSLASVNTNWQDEIFRRGLVQNYALRFSGGSEKTKYLIAGNYFDEDGIIIGSDFLRGSLRLNLDQEISDRFQISARLLTSRSKYNEVNDGLVLLSALGVPPFLPVRNEDGSYVDASTLKQFPFSPSSADNPVAVAEERLNARTIDRILGSVTGRYSLTEHLSLNISAGADILASKRDVYNPRILEAGLPAGSGSKSFNTSTSFLNENTINYIRDFGGIHSLNLVGGFTWQKLQSELLTGSSSGFVNDDLENNILGFGENYSAPSTGYSEWVLLSWLGRINYSLSNKYLFTLSGRADGSSRFGAGNKWGFFPSGAVAWRISEEDFIKDNLQNLSNLKLRLSYGVSGNQAISPYQSLQRFTGVSLAFGGSSTSGFVADNQENPDLRWETTEEFNAGLEVGFWNQRMRMNLDYYVKNTSDLLARVNLPPSSGFRTTIQNIGSTRNSGFEFQLGTVIVSNNKVNWDINLNAYRNVNVVTETAEGQDIIAPAIDILGSANIVRPGEPLSAFFGLKTNGLTEDGLINYVDLNNDGQVNDADRVVIGSPYPDLYYGMSSTVSYGNLSLAVSIVGEAGKTLWNHNKQFFMSSFHRGHNQLVEVATERWTPEKPSGRFPKATNALNQSPSEYYLEDASYLRIQNITLNYKVPLNKLDMKSLSSASIYLGIQNLITFTDYNWYTPDVNSFSSGDLRIGVDQRTYPSARTFMVGMKVGI